MKARIFNHLSSVKTSQGIGTRPVQQTSNISRTLVGNKIVDHSDVVGASPVGTAPTTSSFSTYHMASMDWQLQDEARNI